LDTLDAFALLLVDDHPLFRDGLATALRHQAPGLHVTTADRLEQAMEVLARDAAGFDLVLLDYYLPGINGLRGAELVMKRHPGVAIGLMSGAEDPTLSQRARDAGLVAYLPKTLEIHALIRHLRRLAAGQVVFETSDPWAALATANANPYGLSARQMDVLRVLATGASNKEIANAMGIAPATVKNHLEAIFAKTGAVNRLQAVTLARQLPADPPVT